METKRTQNGQAIVLIVLAMIALLAFTALAVDGSMVYSDRRWAQNVSDSSALAGAGTTAQNMENQGYIYRVGDNWDNGNCPSIVQTSINLGLLAAVARAAENDYTLPNPFTADGGGIKAECVVEGPLPYIDFTSVVHKTTDAAFSQLIFSGGLKNTTTAVARVRPAVAYGWGRSIVALDDRACQGSYGLVVNGAANNFLDVVNGGIWSNGCLNSPGNPSVDVTNGSVEYYYGNEADLRQDIHITDGTLTQYDDSEPRMTAADYPLPSLDDCSGTNQYTGHSNTYTNRTFHDLGTTDHGDTTISLAPGLYCIDDSAQGLSITSHDFVSGSMVTIVMLQGKLDIAGTSDVGRRQLALSAPGRSDVPADYEPAILGLLFYVPESNDVCGKNTDCVTLNGNDTSFLSGTILAPFTQVKFNGNLGLDLFGQIIAWDVDVGGSANSSVRYNPETEMLLPTFLNMQK